MAQEIGTLTDWTKARARAASEGIAVRSLRTSLTVASGEGKARVEVSASNGVDTYTVEVSANADGVFCGCNCKGGEHGRRCKHVAIALARLGYLG